MFSFLKKKKQKVQPFPDDIVMIQSIVSPDGMYHVQRIEPYKFGLYESDKTKIHYCSVIGDKIYISSKAPYDHVVVNGWSAEQVEKLKLNEIK